jgi:hypothetical protein
MREEGQLVAAVDDAGGIPKQGAHVPVTSPRHALDGLQSNHQLR